MTLFFYVMRDFFKYVIGTVVLSIFLFVLFDFVLKSTSYFIKYNPESRHLVLYYIYVMPSLILQALPIAALIASVICMVLLNRTNEITAMRAAGMGPLRIGLPVAVGGAILCVVSIFIGEIVLPQSAKKMRYVESVLIEKDKDLPIIEGAKWIRNGDLLYTFRDFNPTDQSLINVKIIKIGKPFRQRRTIAAEKAVYNPSGNNWTLSDVNILYFWPNGTLSYTEARPKLELEIPLDPNKLQKERRLPSEKSFSELRSGIERDQSRGFDILTSKVEMHGKIAFYFASFVVSLIGLKFGYKSERNMETARGVLLALAIGISYWFIFSAGKAVAKRATINPIIATWLANVTIFSISAISIFRIRKA